MFVWRNIGCNRSLLNVAVAFGLCLHSDMLFFALLVCVRFVFCFVVACCVSFQHIRVVRICFNWCFRFRMAFRCVADSGRVFFCFRVVGIVSVVNSLVFGDVLF